MGLLSKMVSRLEKGKTPYEKSFYVDMVRDSDNIIITAMPVNKNTEYYIVFDNYKDLGDLMIVHGGPIFTGRSLNVESIEGGVVDGRKDMYVQITFDHKKAKALNEEPKVKIVLKHQYKKIATDMYKQLNEQALMQEKGYNNTFNK